MIVSYIYIHRCTTVNWIFTTSTIKSNRRKVKEEKILVCRYAVRMNKQHKGGRVSWHRCLALDKPSAAFTICAVEEGGCVGYSIDIPEQPNIKGQYLYHQQISIFNLVAPFSVNGMQYSLFRQGTLSSSTDQRKLTWDKGGIEWPRSGTVFHPCSTVQRMWQRSSKDDSIRHDVFDNPGMRHALMRRSV